MSQQSFKDQHRLASTQNTSRYFEQANSITTHPMFSDCKSLVKLAIAEWLANQENETLYPHLARNV